MRDYFGKHTTWYWERYYLHCETMPNYKLAWEATEADHFDRFEFYRYEDYAQFRNAKSLRHNAGKPKTDPNQLMLWPL